MTPMEITIFVFSLMFFKAHSPNITEDIYCIFF